MNNNEKEEAAMFFDDPQMLSLGLDEQEHKTILTIKLHTIS